MEITITRTGGIAGVQQILGPVVVDGLSESAAIIQLIEDMRFFDLPPEIPSRGGGDDFVYVTTVDTLGQFNTVLSDDSSDEPYLGQLATMIRLLRDSGVDFLEHSSGFDIDWDELRVLPQTVGGFVVVLRGVTPLPTFVSLEPEDTEQLVDYQPVHVVGRRPESSANVETPWEKLVPLDRLPAGEKGTLLIGATKREYIERHAEVTAS